jgi:L-amino acid N-acyltransferase YncA
MSELIFVDIKSLTEVDLKKIVKIDNNIPAEFDETWKPNETDHERRLKFYLDLLDTDFFKAVLYKNEIIGFYCIKASIVGSVHVGMATTIWVDPSYRKEGIAKQLFDMGIEWAKTQNIKFLQSSVHTNNERSKELHLKSGFKECAITFRLNI